MFLCITFQNETIPFLLDGASTEECLRVIEEAKKEFSFDRKTAIIEEDRIILHASHKKPQPKKRLYCLGDKILLQTDTKCPEEKEPTRELLAYENKVCADKIYVVEV